MTGAPGRGEIHLGDLARALKTLKWQDDKEAKTIAACLGFGLHDTPSTPRPPSEIYDRLRYLAQEPRASTPPPRRIFVPPAPEPPPALPANPLPSRLQALTERAPAAPSDNTWLDEEDAMYSRQEQTAVARRSLLPERTHRHVISAALATLRTGQDIDISKLLRAVCRREVIAELPRRPEATLERGCQLLLDYSTTMTPFWEDLNDLIAQVQDVVGPANTQIYSFDTAPTEAVRWLENGEREKWRPDGRPLLIASDHGIQGKTGRAELHPDWSGFVASCAQAGAPLVVLIPWPESRWPRDIGGYPHLVHWSPHTSATMVKGKIGLGHPVR